MDKITIKIDGSNYFNDELTKYLMNLNGVKNSSLDTDEVYIEYDSSIISLMVLKLELLNFLDCLKIPSIIAFDKHLENATKDTIIIEDLCCEYCLKSMIEELLDMDGINSATTDFDYNNKQNVKIFITYDKDKISSLDLEEIKKKFNNY